MWITDSPGAPKNSPRRHGGHGERIFIILRVLRASVVSFLFGVVVVVCGGCRQDMHDQPKFKPLSSSSFFEDGRSGRPPVPGTVARGLLRDDTHLYTGKSGTTLLDTFPLAINEQSLKHGRERYDIFCSVCHGRTGHGEGMVVRRGFRQPPSFHIDRLRVAPVGHFFDVITRGFGAMPDYAALIPPRDRWEIIAYVRALQLSQQTSIADVSAEGLNQLQGARR